MYIPVTPNKFKFKVFITWRRGGGGNFEVGSLDGVKTWGEKGRGGIWVGE